MIHPLAGLLSAYGIGIADIRRLREQSLNQTLEHADLSTVADRLTAEARAEVQAQDVSFAGLEFVASADLSYAGVDSALRVPLDAPHIMRAAFEARHRERFGFTVPDRPIVVQTLSVEAIASVAAGADAIISAEAPEPAPPAVIPAHFGGNTRDILVHDREALNEADVIAG